MNHHTANIKYIEHKYRNEDKVDIEDVRAMAKHYKDKIKRLKFLLNDTKRDFEERHRKLWSNAVYSQSYVNRFVHVYSEQLEALDKDALKDLEKSLKEQLVGIIKPQHPAYTFDDAINDLTKELCDEIDKETLAKIVKQLKKEKA